MIRITCMMKDCIFNVGNMVKHAHHVIGCGKVDPNIEVDIRMKTSYCRSHEKPQEEDGTKYDSNR